MRIDDNGDSRTKLLGKGGVVCLEVQLILFCYIKATSCINNAALHWPQFTYDIRFSCSQCLSCLAIITNGCARGRTSSNVHSDLVPNQTALQHLALVLASRMTNPPRGSNSPMGSAGRTPRLVVWAVEPRKIRGGTRSAP